MILWSKRDEDPKIQIILICIFSFLLACPYNRVGTVDPIEEVGEERHKLKIIYLLGFAVTNVFGAICTMITGFLMKEKAGYYWHVILGNVALIILI